MGLLKRINDLPKVISGFVGALVMILCIGGIFALAVFLIIWGFNKPVAVVLQTIGTCILMMPIMWGSGNYVRSQVGSIEQTHIDSKKIKEQESKIKDQEKKIDELKGTIRHIESSGFSLQQFERILEVGLVETKLQQAFINKQVFDKQHRGLLPGAKYDLEYLGVITQAMTAIFGIDLKKVRFYNSGDDNNAIMVHGIQPKYLGDREKFSRVEVSEIRKLMLDGNDNETETRIDNSNAARNLAKEKEKELTQMYQERLNQGLQTGFMNETVIKSAQNYISVILAPLKREIIFTDDEADNSLPLADFLKLEMNNKKGELKRITNQV